MRTPDLDDANLQGGWYQSIEAENVSPQQQILLLTCPDS